MTDWTNENFLENEIKAISDKVTEVTLSNLKPVEAVDNLVFAINNLAVVAKEKGNKYGY